ncbi:MAG: MMPL family transporter [Bacteroidales bacterium]
MTNFISRYKWFIISFCILTGLLSGIMIPQIKVDPEIRNYVPPSIKSRLETEKIETEFGVQDLVVILFSDRTILNSDNLKQINDIDRSISRINGVSNRVSPFTVRSIRNKDGMMIVDPLIKSIPDDSIGLSNLGREILSNRFARDIVISSDLTTATITATINNTEPEFVTLHRVDSVIDSHPGTTVIRKGGLPYIRQSLMKDVTRDAIVLVPAALAIMLLVLKFNLGRWRLVMMPFTVVLISTGFSLALIPLLGWKMSIITLLVPIILIAVANNYGIYLVARFQELKAVNIHSSTPDLLSLLIRSLNMPILFSGLTTIAGILGLLIHSIIPARQVGVLAAAGVSLALLMSLLLIPVLILISGSGLSFRKNPINKTYSFNKLLTGLSTMIIKYPGRIIMVSAITLFILSSGMVFLRINTNVEAFFSKKHPARQASEIINSKFGGSQTISVMIEGDIRDPEVMKGIDNLTFGLEQENGVGNVFSISQVVREMSKAIYTSTEEGYNMIPETREGIAQMFELYNMSGSQDDFKELMNLENTKAHLLIRLSDPENRIVNQVKSKITDLTKDLPGKVTVGGYAIIMTDFAASIIKGQILSLLFAIITVLILLTIIFKSLRGGLIGSIPLVASVLVLFGFMGFAGLALDAATALLSSIMIGVGVDFTIQYMWCFNLQISRGMKFPEATDAAMKTIGRSIIINAISVMAGFSALMLSGFLSIRFFGYLVVVSIGSCLIGALVVVPAILMKFKPGFMNITGINKYRKNETKNDVISVTPALLAGSSTIA